jgi:hypothetical protein
MLTFAKSRIGIAVVIVFHPETPKLREFGAKMLTIASDCTSTERAKGRLNMEAGRL